MKYTLLTLFVGLCITFTTWYGVTLLLDRITQEKFKSSAVEVESIVASRIREYFAVFNFTQGLFVTQNDITPEEFYAYYDSIQLANWYPGFTAVSLTAAVDATEKETFIELLKTNTVTSSTISAQVRTDNNTRYLVTFIYPPEQYKNSLGADLTDNIDRKEAIESARDTAELAVTKPTKLLSTQQPGFIAYLPLYKKDASISNLEQRREAFIGVLSGGFNSNDFFQEVLPTNTMINDFSIHMYDGDTREDASLVYAREEELNPEESLEHHVSIPIGDRTWNMYISANSSLFLDSVTRRIPMIVLVVGTITTMLASVTVYLLSSSRARALSLAEKMSAEARNKSKELTIANEKLKDLDKLKDEFVSVASHELRTPMTAIKGMISMIFDGDYGNVSDELKEPLTDIQGSTDRLIHLVNDMLNVSRIEAGRLRFDLEEVNSKELVEQVGSSLSPIAKEKNITLEVTQFPDAKVQVDCNKLQQILNNLIGNSLKFTDTGSITISGLIKDQLLEIHVADTGMGIKPEDQAKLFSKFAQISSQQLGKPAGTGLGLFISKEIAEHMGGTMWIDHSELGKGSTFAFSVPLAGTEAARKVALAIQKEATEHPDQKSDTVPAN